MNEPEPGSSSIADFETWAPVLRLLRAGSSDQPAGEPVRVTGRIGMRSWSLNLPRRMPPLELPLQTEDMADERGAVNRVRTALADAGIEDLSFTAEVFATGRTVLHLLGPSSAAPSAVGNRYPHELILVEGSVPEPWRRLPKQFPDVAPAPSADAPLLELTLRERLPDAIGATEQEIADAESCLGVALPAELKALYRVTRARWEDWNDAEAAHRVMDAVGGFELFPLDQLYIADPASRPSRWDFGAMQAIVTPPDAAVQQLVGSAGWIAFGDTGGGDRLAVDLTPGPRGHVGQVVILSHEEHTGAGLVADSLTDLVLRRPSSYTPQHHDDQPAIVAHVNARSPSLRSVEAAAHPGLEVLSLGVWEGEPASLAPVIGLPRLRTLCAYPGTLADPLEIAELTGLEFLQIGARDWRVLLDAGAVPSSLSAAAIEAFDEDPLAIVALADEILALWRRPPIPQTVVEGVLG
ncbi:MAG: SMI1/KNR4 family protein [Catenulispora sp.]|nr:SMI1/KNR4 family protein [Catenulispora sp.]